MTITYPECQIELEVDEAIELMDYMERKEPVIQCRPPELHGLDPVEFKHFGLDDDAKKWLEETVQDSFNKIHQQLLEQTDPNRHGDGILPLIKEEPLPEFDPTQQREDDPLAGVSFEDPNPEPDFEPGGFVPENPNEGHLVEGETVKKGVGLPEPVKKALKEKQTKKIDVLFDDYGWKTFNSVSEAAKAIDARLNHFNHALLNNTTCNGHHVRYHATEPAPGTELPPAKHPAYSARKVDVQAEDGSWSTFDTVTLAAFHLGVTAATVSLACRKERKVKGHAVRYHDDTDDIMAEIEASNKKPYQPTPPVR